LQASTGLNGSVMTGGPGAAAPAAAAPVAAAAIATSAAMRRPLRKSDTIACSVARPERISRRSDTG